MASGSQIGAAGAAVSVVVLPVLVAAAFPSAAEPSPATSALTVHVTASSGVSPGTGPFLVRVGAPSPPPTAAAVASDAAGRNVARIEPVDTAECEHVVRRRLKDRDATEDWCLRVVGLGAGSESSAVLHGAPSASGTPGLDLTVTLGVRHSFWFLPLVVAVLGLLTALALALLPVLTRSLVRPALLRRELLRNERGGTEQIGGLRERVQLWLHTGKSPDDVLGPVRDVVSFGVARDQVARAELLVQVRQAQQSLTRPDDYVFLRGALDESGRTDHHVDELVDAETLENTAPTASRWADGLTQLLQYADRLSGYASTIPGLPVTPNCKRVLQRAHERADTALRKLPGPTLDGYQRDFDAFVEGYEATLIDPECQDTTLGPSGATDTIYAYDVGPPVAPTVPEAPAPVSADLAGTNNKAVALTVLGVVALVALMLTTVAMATWAPKPTFGTGADYWAVFAAAFASSAGAAVFALLRLWAVTDDE